MFHETKSAFKSRTIIGGAVALLAGAAGVFDWSVSPADQADLTTAIIGLVSSVGGIAAIVGRVRATRRIG